MAGVTNTSPTVSIRPGVGMLSVLKHLNYKPWFALAEFVDNALQSFLTNRERLTALHGADFRLKVWIELDRSEEMSIKIRDNAAGIATSEYGRAFRPASLPAETSGLSEFGMGMKSAACWFAPRWSVRTSALGEKIERTVSFDIAKIVRDDIQELEVAERPTQPDSHFTELTLADPYNKLLTRTSGKVRNHLASIYRIFMRDGVMDLYFDGDLLAYEMPEILFFPNVKVAGDPPRRWRREFSFDFGNGLKASGFAALRAEGSTATAGFALFRRNRLIEGSWDEPYRPGRIFGSGNTYRKQRLFGEIHLEGFEVSHTKDGFRWEEHEDAFLEILYEELETTELPMLSQAESYRSRTVARELREEAEKANERVAESIASQAPPILEAQSSRPPVAGPPPLSLPPDPSASTRTIEIRHRGETWRVVIELSLDEGIGDWLWLSDRPPASRGAPREITVRMALAHPFMRQFCRPESAEIEALERVAAALALAEVTARDSGVLQYGSIRRNVNELLREALAQP